jgi:hypothetical protein
MELTYERARDTLAIIMAFCEAIDDSDPPDFTVTYDDQAETITVEGQGLTYRMQISAEDENYHFTAVNHVPDWEYPVTVVVPIREIATLTFEE